MLQEQIADVETIDRICRMEGGFRMGPFELMDLVGVDTGFEISKSFYEQSFGEPRWRPSLIAARYVAAGLHGRKSGRGYYNYADPPTAARHRPDDPPAPSADAGADGEGVVVIAGAGALADELRAAADAAGYEVRSPHAPSGRRAAGAGDRLRPGAGRRQRAAARPTAPRHAGARRRAARACCCARAARWRRSTPAAARSAFTCCRRSARRGWSS